MTETETENKIAVLPSPILLEEGEFRNSKISLETATELIDKHGYTNYSGHQTVKILGIEPSKTRSECLGYKYAIIIKPNPRLQFGLEYTVEQIKKIGYAIYLIEKIA